MTNVAVVSCLFGQDDFDIYPAPLPEFCFFFTNREEIAEHAKRRMWQPVLMPTPNEEDPLNLSIQSKFVKYLHFLKDPIYRKLQEKTKGCGVLYADHKFYLEAKHVEQLVKVSGDAAVVIRSTPRLKNSVWDEVNEAVEQRRYAQNMEITKIYIQMMIENGFTTEIRICNTGLIYYARPYEALPLAENVLAACVSLKQPECQIFWALHMQRYSESIRVIDWENPAVVDVLWQDPRPPATAQKRRKLFSGRVEKLLGFKSSQVPGTQK